MDVGVKSTELSSDKVLDVNFPSKLSKLQELVDTSEDMRSLIECPVCLEMPLPPIFLCSRGHLICGSCQNKTSSCPICRSHYSTTRSFVAEGIIEKLSLACKYRDQGCKTVLLGSKISEHVKQCEYRPLKCVDCLPHGKPILFGDYFAHLVSKHNINGVKKTKGRVLFHMEKTDLNNVDSFTKYYWPPYYYKGFGDKIFLVRLIGNVSFACIWISLVGTKEMCKKYEAKIEYTLEGEKGFSLRWKGVVNNVRDDPISDVIASGRGLILPLDFIQMTSKPNSKLVEWTYLIRIKEIPKKICELPLNQELKVKGHHSTSKSKLNSKSNLFGRGDSSHKKKSVGLGCPNPRSRSRYPNEE